MADLSPPVAWAHLPFFTQTLPGISQALAEEDRAVFPPKRYIFRALDLTPPEATKVVILGQDPYHTAGKADGLAFSIPQDFGGRLDSLGNIFKELESDLGAPRDRTDLSDWARQGVLLLNTALTVPEGKAKGHAKLGWAQLTRDVLIALSDRPCAFVLWGGPAQSFARHITGPDHLILRSPHPSPLSVYRGFFGSRPFSQVNVWLIARGEDPINWTKT
ncbi:uracil-DNA glycosylase [Puniceibacterium sp. IMCC21224]|uniref:uracil-DNA glycosylase n=1 Tax=Puniceibacterium sp. IMCC21224 TaxID=1618204 RepID=UPI00064DF25C|nr:uracil-DNA glycosylase [Puniceibacterium sp. IMCC21224]KMK67125.1 Uracil-DNA glycosylase [Puniceibacterium sp. IMCC21224]